MDLGDDELDNDDNQGVATDHSIHEPHDKKAFKLKNFLAKYWITKSQLHDFIELNSVS